jgi:tetratricopeptide (TPR) repeat protein
MNHWRPCVLGLALALGWQAQAAPSGEAAAKLERAGRLSAMADTSKEAGNFGAAISFKRKALKQVEAIALGGDPAEIEPGRRMIQLDLGDLLLADRKWNEALDVFRDIASAQGGSLMDYARIRSLKGILAAEAGLGRWEASKAALGDLIGQSRAMLAKDKTNGFLTRQLAELMEADTVVRYWTDSNDAAMRASAAETLDLFRAISAANPESPEARRAAFVWAWANAKITNAIPMWKETLEQGRWLEARRELKGREALLAEAQRKMEIYERDGLLPIGR